jgi:transcriptional regulator with XRE-family HTH domain
LKSRIYDVRKQNNLSLKGLSILSGIPVNTLWRMESGYGVTLRNAFKVAKAFQLTIYEVWDIPSRPHAKQNHQSGERATNMRRLRLQRGWRLHDLAKRSGVSKTTLAKIENGHSPTLKNAVRIAGAFGLSVYEIWSVGSDER